MSMKILTLNLRHHRDRWEERFPLVVDVLRTHSPDIIGFQEVWRPVRQAHMILNQLSDTRTFKLHVVPKQGISSREGIAIASRYPITHHDAIDLPGDGDRVAQRALIDVNGTTLCFANTHLHDKPADERVRLPQMKALLQWLADVHHPIILTGDMNARPESTTIQEVKNRYQSAYEVVHHVEPAVTCPTPLDPKFHPDRCTTIDYIFVAGDTLQVTDASIVADNPDPDDETLYPSDHYGILASIKITASS